MYQSCYTCCRYRYCITRNFGIVQILANFADASYTAKIKPTNLKVRNCGLCLGAAFPLKIKTTKIFLGASAGISAKVCTCKNFVARQCTVGMNRRKLISCYMYVIFHFTIYLIFIFVLCCECFRLDSSSLCCWRRVCQCTECTSWVSQQCYQCTGDNSTYYLIFHFA